jgi:5-methylcytosine-specific restriction endonuclease McrA
MSSLKGSLKKRSEEYDVLFNISGDDIRQLFYDSYNTGCKYCGKPLTYKTIACDHIVPLSKKGKSIISNLQLICKTCNTRKGPLDEDDFVLLIELVATLPDELKAYIMRKLAKGGRY